MFQAAVSADQAIEAFWQRELEEHRVVLQATREALAPAFTRVLEVCEQSIRGGGKLLIFGNGGSAADAQHIAAELVVRYKTDRPAIAAIALTTDTSALTACSNDLGFEAVFGRQVEALGRPGDVAMGISTSGRSPNVLAGLTSARKLGLRTVGLCGVDGGGMAPLCDALLVVPSKTTARIQEMHITLGHALCSALEHRLGMLQQSL